MYRRTKIFRIFSILCLLTLLCSVCLPLYAETTEEMSFDFGAEYAAVVNAETGRVLYGKNEETQVYCGFLPRVMTCILLLEHGSDLSETVTLSSEVRSNTPQVSSAKLGTGDSISLYDLMRCVLVANSQEAAVAIALHLADSLPSFVAKMNMRAKELGAEHTHFTNVHGYYSTGTAQTTTMTDAAHILAHAITLDSFVDVTKEKYIKITVNGKERGLYTRNSMIDSGSSYYDKKANGLVVYGDTRIGAGVASMVTDKKITMIAVSATNGTISSLYPHMSELLDYALSEYSYKTLITASAPVCEIPVRFGKERDYVVLAAADTISAPLPRSIAPADVTQLVESAQLVEAPVEKGTVLGTLTLVHDGIVYGTTDLVAQSTVTVDVIATYTERINALFGNGILWLILIGLLVLLLLYIFFTYMKNRKKIRKSLSKPDEKSGTRIRF